MGKRFAAIPPGRLPSWSARVRREHRNPLGGRADRGAGRVRSRRRRHLASEAPSAAAVACDTFTILNHRTDLDQSGDWKKLYVDPFQAKYPGIKAITTESITDYHNIVKTRLNTTDYGDVLVIPNGVTASEYPNFFEPLGTRRRPQGQVPVHRGDRQLRGQGLRHRHQRQRQRHPVQQEGLRRRPASPTGRRRPTSSSPTSRPIKDKVPGVDPLYTNYKAGWPMSQWQPYTAISVADPDFSAKMAHDASPWDPGKGQYITDKLLYDVVKAGLNEKDPTTTDWEPSKQLVATGKIGVMALGSWAISQMQGVAKTAGADPADIGYMPFPNQVDGKFQSTTGGDLRLAINKNTKCMDAAKAWVSYFIDESGYAANENGIPTSVDRRRARTGSRRFQDAGREPVRREPAAGGRGRPSRQHRQGGRDRHLGQRLPPGASSTTPAARPTTAWTRSSRTSTRSGPTPRPRWAADPASRGDPPGSPQPLGDRFAGSRRGRLLGSDVDPASVHHGPTGCRLGAGRTCG